MIHRLLFGCFDARWKAFGIFLRDTHAGPNETYSGYIDYWDEVLWQKVMFDDSVECDFNFAVQAQYVPKYTGEILGTVENLVKLLNDDGILYDEKPLEEPENPEEK